MATQNDSAGGLGLKRMLFDFLSGLLFLALYLTTNNLYLAVGIGLVVGVGQAIWMIRRGRSVDPMQWMALALVLVLGAATMVTHNPTFVVLKPSIFEGCLAAMMLRPNWAGRYAPAKVRHLIPPGFTLFWGYVWAVAWFGMAASNLVVARVYGLKAWAIYTSFSPWALIAALMALGAVVGRAVVLREARVRGVQLPSFRAAH